MKLGKKKVAFLILLIIAFSSGIIGIGIQFKDNSFLFHLKLLARKVSGEVYYSTDQYRILTPENSPYRRKNSTSWVFENFILTVRKSEIFWD